MTEACDLTAVDARRMIGTKRLSPKELMQSCIDRIERVDGAVNAMVARDFDRALAAAAKAEEAVSKGAKLGALHGLPVGVKDLNATEGLRTTMGSPLYADNVPDKDGRIVRALREAGAIVIGKTNTPEFGAGANTTNAVYGPTRNPFDTARICGGSSGGSAVALACGMAPLCTGSDTGGSLRTPAAFCGVVSHRSTTGLVPSNERAVAMTTYNVQGPMARTVDDTALMLSALAGEDNCDILSGPPIDASALAQVQRADLGSLRVGWSPDLGFAPVDDTIAGIFSNRMGQAASLFNVCERKDPALETAMEVFWLLRGIYFIASHHERYRDRKDELGPNVLSNYEAAIKMPVEKVAWATGEQKRLHDSFQTYFDDFDVLICPATSVPPFPVEQLWCEEINGRKTANYVEWLAITSGLTLTGHPVTVLPMGLDHTGAPLGIQIVGPKRHSDSFVLSVAAALEDAFSGMTDLRRPIPDLTALAAA